MSEYNPETECKRKDCSLWEEQCIFYEGTLICNVNIEHYVIFASYQLYLYFEFQITVNQIKAEQRITSNVC